MDRITIRIPKSLANRLRVNSRASGNTLSEVVRAALEAYLGGNETPSAFDVATALGLIGCAGGLPKDLSTNRRHYCVTDKNRPSGAKARVIFGAKRHG